MVFEGNSGFGRLLCQYPRLKLQHHTSLSLDGGRGDLVGVKRPPSGVVRRFGEEVAPQVSSSLSVRGCKLRGPPQNSRRVALKRAVDITELTGSRWISRVSGDSFVKSDPETVPFQTVCRYSDTKPQQHCFKKDVIHLTRCGAEVWRVCPSSGVFLII
ncbi:hypothetical protein AVEN_194587-1 [Araneus ventricosus]|uniref:Uncharacterized protein n=1 Tax=Araneus ventricosus TaxID=182803 RepID=A0A4Y2A8Z6_ARAVE|nr:hypothetical protein AVEN_194587-1 [Araneus ventricosus]